MFFPAEGPDDRDSLKDFSRHQVQAVDEVLQFFKPRKGDGKKHSHHAQHQNNGQKNDPGHAPAGLQRMDHTADSQDRRIENHPEKQHQHHLHLLNIVGASGDQGSRGEMLEFLIGKRNHLCKDTLAERSGGSRCQTAGKEGYSDGDHHDQKGKAQHL